MQAQKDSFSSGSTWGFAILFGVLLAGMQESFGGFVVGALLGALLAQVMQLRDRASKLEQKIQSLQATPTRTEQRAAPTQRPVPPAVETAPVPVASSAPVATVATTTPVSRPIGGQPAVAAERFQPQTPTPPPPTWVDNLVAGSIDWLKRGNPVARIGIVILFFGGAFLAKYAAENSLFPIELRFVAIALGAFALLIVGWRLRERRAVYAQLLQGGGIAGLYLTVFAATSLFKLLPFGLALALLIVIAVAAAILAVAQDALSLAVIATAGGFMAPILVSSGSSDYVALFTYYAILNVGIFAVAWFRTWRLLNVLGFLFTFTITGIWRATSYTPADLVAADAFLMLFFAMYVAVSILNCIRQPPDLKGYVSGSLVFGLPIVAFTLHATLIARIEYGLAWSALILGAFYMALAWTLYLTRRETLRLLAEAFAALSVIFASLAIPLAFDTHTTAAMWAVEGAGLLWLGVRQDRRLARAFAALLLVAGSLSYLNGLDRHHAAHAVLNSTYLSALLLALACSFSGYTLYRNRERQAAYENGADSVFTFAGVTWWLLAGLREIDLFAPTMALGAALLYVSATSALLALAGSKLKWPLPQRIALSLPALCMVAALSYASLHSHPFAQWAAPGWIAIVTVHYWMLRRLDAVAETSNTSEWLHAGGCWVIALIAAWEASWHIDFHAAGVWPSLPWGLAPALLLGWLARHTLRPAWPLQRFADAYRVRGALPLAVATLGWIVVVNLTSDGDPQWLPYVPLLNPLDVSVGVCVAALALWWTALTEAQRCRVWQGSDKALLGGMAAIAFLWLNAALLRSLHHNWNTPLSIDGMAHDALVQASLSVFWGLLGFTAMTLAAKKHWRYVWIIGGVLMSVVVAKLIFVDLSSIGTLARITSYLSVGALLVVTGYLAPLPPRQDGKSEVAS